MLGVSASLSIDLKPEMKHKLPVVHSQLSNERCPSGNWWCVFWAICLNVSVWYVKYVYKCVCVYIYTYAHICIAYNQTTYIMGCEGGRTPFLCTTCCMISSYPPKIGHMTGVHWRAIHKIICSVNHWFIHRIITSQNIWYPGLVFDSFGFQSISTRQDKT